MAGVSTEKAARALPDRADLLAEKERRSLQKALLADAEMAARCKASLSTFVRAAWPFVEIGTPFLENFHIDAVCDHLQALFRRDIKRLIINVPPRTGKSTLSSVCFPVWAWLNSPGFKLISCSYDAALAVRDSNKSRKLIATPWFEKVNIDPATGEPYFRMSNLKIKGCERLKDLDHWHENDRGGHRFAVGVAGGVTGKGGNCLPYDSLVTTEHGLMQIGKIAEERLPVRVLSHVGNWQSVTNWFKNPGRELLEFITEAGDVFACTDDHPLWIRGHGWLTAKEVLYLEDEVYLYRLSGSIRAESGARSSVAGNLLLDEVLGSSRERGKKSCLEGRTGRANLPALLETFPSQAGESHRWEVLFSPMQGGRPLRDESSPMPYLQEVLSPELFRTDSLLEGLRGGHPPFGDSGGRQRALDRRGVEESLLTWLHQEAQEGHFISGRWPVCGLFDEAYVNLGDEHASHRRFQDESQPYESGHPVHLLSPPGSSWTDKQGLDEPTRVVSVRRRPAPDAVYDLTVAVDHSFYANGIAVSNCISADDPIDPRRAYSDVERGNALTWWDSTMSTRLDNPKEDLKLIVMQRLHVFDLSGHELAKNEGYVHLKIPMEFKSAGRCVTVLGPPAMEATEESPARPPPRVWQDPRTEEDEPLWRARFDVKEIESFKQALGPYGFAGQMQQDPLPEGGGIFKLGWFNRWDKLPIFDLLAISVDAAFTDSATSSFVVCQVWGFKGPKAFLLDQVRKHLDYTSTKQTIRDLREKYAGSKPPVSAVIIEKKANGAALINELSLEFAGVDGITPTESKESRAAAVSPFVASGNVYLPEEAPWLGDFLWECGNFPKAGHDDQVDGMTQILWWRWLKDVEVSRSKNKSTFLKWAGAKIGAAT